MYLYRRQAALSRRVDWNGVTAFYRPAEDQLMRRLREAGAGVGELAVLHSLMGLLDARLVGEAPAPRRSGKRIYAVVWQDRHRIVPTKKAGLAEMRLWADSYRKQGWTVRTLGKGSYVASDGQERRVVVLHEYDAVTKERVD